MKKFNVDTKAVQLKKGTVVIYQFGDDMRIHSYETKDIFNSYLLLIEKDDKLLLLEPPLLKDNFSELHDYINAVGFEELDLLVSYHNLGATFANSNKIKINTVYSMPSTEKYVYETGVEANKQIKSAIGDLFDDEIYQNVVLLEEGNHSIQGIEIYVKENEYGYDIGLPEIKVMHTHFVGHDKHILVWDEGFLDYTQKDLKDYLDAGYDIFMSAHQEAETRSDVRVKIEYFEKMKMMIKNSINGEAFKKNMVAAYPDLGWLNYLEVTAALLYKEPIPGMEG